MFPCGNYRFLAIFLLFCVFVFFGCAGETYRLYSGPSLPHDEIAVLLLSSRTTAILFAVDGTHGPHDVEPLFPNKKSYSSSIGSPLRLELLPGRHTLTIGFSEDKMTVGGRMTQYSAIPHPLEFEAKEGRTYTIEAEMSEGKWKAKVVEIATDQDP